MTSAAPDGQASRVVARPMLAVVVTVLLASGCDGGGDSAAPDVPYEDVQSVFDKYGCVGCHPGVNPSLDLTAENSYDELVGAQALADPTLYRVVAGDPSSSLLYLKLGGDPVVADIPGIGTRMPPRAPPIDEADLATVRDWILGGAKGVDGETGGPEVTTPGTPPPSVGDRELAAEQRGSGTISGLVIDQRPARLLGLCSSKTRPAAGLTASV